MLATKPHVMGTLQPPNRSLRSDSKLRRLHHHHGANEKAASKTTA